MAKIFGIFNKNKQTPKETLKLMASSFQDFGFYKKSFYSNNGLSLGELFLKKEEAGFFQSKDKKFLVLFSGYLLNEDQREKPAEFVFKLFSKLGKKFIKKLNGIFNIVIYQKDKKILYIFNDRYGVLPFYYYQDKNNFIFASEVKAIIALRKIDKEIDWSAWSDYFSFRYLLGDKTFFKKIKSLPNASWLSYQNGKIVIEKYWDYSEIKIDRNHNEKYFVDKGNQLVKEAIIKSSKGIDKAVCFLSGGYDSRCLAAGLKKYTKVNFDTYTTEHPTGRKDYLLAKKVAQKLKLKNYFIKHPKNIYKEYFLKKNYLLDGLAQEHLWSLPLSDSFKSSNFIFDGLAGDLLLKGLFLNNDNLRFVKDNQKLSSILADQYGYSLFFVRKFFKDNIQKQLDFSKKTLASELKSIPSFDNKISIFFAKNRTRNSLCLLSNNIFPQLIKRFPFLDNDLVDFALSSPPEIKINRHLYEKIIQKSFPELAKVPTTNDSSLVKKLDDFTWRFLTKLKIQRAIKSFLKNYLFCRDLSRDDVDYLILLLTRLEIPDYINKKRVGNYLTKKKFDFSLVCLIEHLIWYNFFYQRNFKVKYL